MLGAVFTKEIQSTVNDTSNILMLSLILAIDSEIPLQEKLVNVLAVSYIILKPIFRNSEIPLDTIFLYFFIDLE